MVEKLFVLASYITNYDNPQFNNPVGKQFAGENIGNSASDYALSVLVTVISELLNLVMIAALIIIAAAGIRYIIASGNDTQKEAAHKTLLYGLLGLLIAIFSWTIVRVISFNIVEKATDEQVYVLALPDGDTPFSYRFVVEGVDPDEMDEVVWKVNDTQIDIGGGNYLDWDFTDNPGTHTIFAEVTTDGGATYSDSIELLIQGTGGATLVIGPTNGATVYPGINNVDAAKVDNVEWVWDTGQDPDPNQTGLSAEHTYATSGEKNVTATITYKDGFIDSVSGTVEIQEDPNNIIIDYVADGFTVDLSLSGGVNASKISAIMWDFGTGEDLESSTSPSITHLYPKHGTYTAEATVIFNTGDPEKTVSAPIEITLEPEYSCNTSNETTCTLENVQAEYVERIEYQSDINGPVDAVKVPDIDGEEALTFSTYYAPNPDPVTAVATIYYKIDSEVYEATTEVTPDSEGVQLSTSGDGYERTFIIENFAPEYVDVISFSPYGSSPGTGSSIEIFNKTTDSPGLIAGGTYEYDYFYDNTGVFGDSSSEPIWVEVAFDQSLISADPQIAELDTANAVSINDPEPTISHSYDVNLNRLRVSVQNYGDPDEVERYRFDLNGTNTLYGPKDSPYDYYDYQSIPDDTYTLEVTVIYKENADGIKETITITYDTAITIGEPN